MELKITLDKKTLEVLEKLVEKIGVFPVPVSPETLQVIPQAVSPAVDPALQSAPQVVQPIPQVVQPTPEIIPAVGPATTQPVAAPVQAPTPQPAQLVQTVQPVQPVQPVQLVQTQAPVYTQQQLALAGTQLMDAGRQDEVVALLGQFGAQALTQLSVDQYGAFASGLRALGAKI